jgi:hypothetical protein
MNYNMMDKEKVNDLDMDKNKNKDEEGQRFVEDHMA